MTTGADAHLIDSVRTRPLGWRGLLFAGPGIWVAGALYCSGYERLASGIDNWPESLLWSAIAVLPWLALFEWSKSQSGRRIMHSPARVAMALVLTASASLGLEFVADWMSGTVSSSIGLSLLRRVPAIGASLLLIVWSRLDVRNRTNEPADNAHLVALASSIDWIEAADNYVELHIAERVLIRRMTMREAEKSLAGRRFVRIHRRFLVNADRISGVIGTNGHRVVQLVGGNQLPVGRAFAANLDDAVRSFATSPQIGS